ncbi:unnamed protein product, partial [Brenthis ino]
MFESDDYDQILSQIDFPEIRNPECKESNIRKEELLTKPLLSKTSQTSCIVPFDKEVKTCADSKENTSCAKINLVQEDNVTSAKHTKRKIINSFFDHKSKRKFPGPAGLLTGSFEQNQDETICQMELLTQDMDFTQNYLHGDIFETPLWKRLTKDTQSLGQINSINAIKHQALAGNLQRKKAQVVAAFVESVDRSVIDPLITLRDTTGIIKCTLHRDAWNTFSNYIVSEYCALVLWKPTVLTTGSAFKKHYLNITLSNITAIYTSTVINDEQVLPNGYSKFNEEEYSIIRIDRTENCPPDEAFQENFDLDDLDNIFSNDMF